MAESSGVAVKLFGKTILVRLHGDLTAAPDEEGEGGDAGIVVEEGGKFSTRAASICLSTGPALGIDFYQCLRLNFMLIRHQLKLEIITEETNTSVLLRTRLHLVLFCRRLYSIHQFSDESLWNQESPSWEHRYVKQATSPSTVEQEAAPAKCPKPEEAENGGATCPPEKKIVRKPDRVLPCPRCNSMDTKFCYYNNYNLAQPRHFCRGCQRYWTAGGAMRNLPVGAGRRKSKHSSSYHRPVTILEPSLHAVHPHPVMKPNGAILRLGSGMPPLFDSMATVLKLPDKKMGREQHIDVAPHSGRRGAVENGEHSSGYSATAFNSAEGGCGTDSQGRAPQGSGENPPEAPSLNEAPWPYLFSSAPASRPSSFPIPFYPTTAYWGCVVTDAWGVPWPAPPFSSSPSRIGPLGFAPGPPPLRQHLRDEDGLTQDEGKGPLCIPKPLRIDDPEVVAKSSVWAAMGLKGDKAGGISKGGLFMAFDQPKTETRKPSVETPLLLHANPAALSRSLNFHES